MGDSGYVGFSLGLDFLLGKSLCVGGAQHANVFLFCEGQKLALKDAGGLSLTPQPVVTPSCLQVMAE